MLIQDITIEQRAEYERLIASVPFYAALQNQSSAQCDLLLQCSRLAELDADEMIMRHGEVGHWLYFLLAGRVHVYGHDHRDQLLSVLSVGEMFGEMAMLTAAPRNATVKAAPHTQRVTLLATDFSVFGKLANFHPITLPTKLLFYRMLVQRARWRLEKNKMLHPEHPFFLALSDLPLRTAPLDSVAELQQLHDEALSLTTLLRQWNELCANQPQPLSGAA
ncbi:MAG: cyclic nucleotide-binding domain-containing protein [Pseudomonadales bacterium]